MKNEEWRNQGEREGHKEAKDRKEWKKERNRIQQRPVGEWKKRRMKKKGEREGLEGKG